MEPVEIHHYSQLKLKPNDAGPVNPTSRRQISAAAARTGRQRQSEHAGSGQKDRSPNKATSPDFHRSPPKGVGARARRTPSPESEAINYYPYVAIRISSMAINFENSFDAAGRGGAAVDVRIPEAREWAALTGHCAGGANGSPPKQQRPQTAATKRPPLQREVHSGQAPGHRQSRPRRAAFPSCLRPVRRRS